MNEIIAAPTAVSFPHMRPQKRSKGETRANFSRWMSGEKEANEPVASMDDFLVPFMSVEGILILAQAHEEEFAMAAKAYETVAEQNPEEETQYEFAFFIGEHILSEEI